MTELFLGVDGGGTKTHAALMDVTGRVIALGHGAPANWERVGMQGTIEALTAAIDGALAQSGHARRDITSATFALAGIDWDTDVDTMGRVVSEFGLGCTPHVMNDAIAVLLAGTSDGIGCASVAGTGGKTVGQDTRRMVTTLGMGLGEGGGAGQIVDQTLVVIAQAYHGQRAATALTEAALQATGHERPERFFEAVARADAGLPESFAPVVFAIAERGDVAALEVVRSVAAQHARDVVGIADGLDFGGRVVPVVCAGGLHTASSAAFDASFRAGLANSRWSLAPVVLDVVPVVGALVDAATRAHGCMTSDQRALLLATAEEA